ncbi:MAG: hypothetical protein K2L96_06845 [Muribaculaceae bacterium]|nr:hypothetical protein [Muribaculaceae bacterium]
MRPALISLSLLSALAAQALELNDTLPPYCHSFVYTLRLQAARTATPTVAVSLQDGHRFNFRVPCLADAADGMPARATLTLTDSLGNILARNTGNVSVDAAEKGFSIRLSSDAGGLHAAIGGPGEEIAFDIRDFPTATAGTIKATLPDGAKIIRHHLRARQGEAPVFSVFSNLDSLRAYLAQSTDPREGIYEYLDKNIPTRGIASISRPEAYRFAITRNPASPDSYQIIYLQGNSAGWKPLEIKATLTPTTFIGHYNMRWIDSQRNAHTTDTYAQYNENASLLTLSFPLLQSTIRLQKTTN